VPFIAKYQTKGNSPASQRIRRNKISNAMHLNFLFDPGFHSSKMASLRHPFRIVGCTMKKWSLVLLAVALVMPATALAQHSSKAAEAKPSGLKAAKSSAKAITISGQISLDGKTLVSEENDIWSVSNPNVLAGHEGQQVLVKCQMNADKNEIHVFSIKAALMEVKSASNKTDSAFRR
jgi:hypothetical protein